MIDFKAILLRALPFVAVLAVGVGIGWGVKPDVVQVKEKEKVVEKEVTTEAMKSLMASFENLRTELQKVRETQVNEKYHRETLETRLADGTYTKKTTVDKNIDSHTKETETKVEVKVVEVEKKVETVRTEYVDKFIEKEKLVTPTLAQWHLGVLVGAAPRFDSPPDTPVLVGVEVERRILGPFFVGAWGMAGSPVVGGFKVVNGALGLKVGAEF